MSAASLLSLAKPTRSLVAAAPKPPQPAGPEEGAQDAEDTAVDFSNASLYLSGIQTVFSICSCAVVSVLSCWIVPEGGVSAVRTLAFCVGTGALLMRKPLRVGRAHGVRVVFASLQPAVPLYLLTLVVEQLIHTCTSDTSHAPSWRRVVFHGMILVMLVAGLMRARAPLLDTDMPFLLTAAALLVIALMPPPAVALVGPLCQSVTMWEAADRLVRSFTFAVVYCAHVYALTANTSLTSSEAMIVVTRAGSASIWTMGAHIAWLPAAILQCGLVIVTRISIENGGQYRALLDAASTDDDVELGNLNNGGVAGVGYARGEAGAPVAGKASSLPSEAPSAHANQTQTQTQHALLQALDQERVEVEVEVDVLRQQRELLAQPSAVSMAFPQRCAGGFEGARAHAHRHCNGWHASHTSYEPKPEPKPELEPEPEPEPEHALGAAKAPQASAAAAATAATAATVPADPAFGPRSFREVVAPVDAAQQLPPPLRPLAVPAPRPPGGPPPPPSMTAARMAEIAASIPDEDAGATDAGRGA